MPRSVQDFLYISDSHTMKIVIISFLNYNFISRVFISSVFMFKIGDRWYVIRTFYDFSNISQQKFLSCFKYFCIRPILGDCYSDSRNR